MTTKGEDRGRGMANDGKPVKLPLSRGILTGRQVKPPLKPTESGKKK